MNSEHFSGSSTYDEFDPQSIARAEHNPPALEQTGDEVRFVFRKYGLIFDKLADQGRRGKYRVIDWFHWQTAQAPFARMVRNQLAVLADRRADSVVEGEFHVHP